MKKLIEKILIVGFIGIVVFPCSIGAADDDFDLLLFMPAILASANNDKGTITSYKNFKDIELTPRSLPVYSDARTYGDFSGSGGNDLFTASITYWPPTTPEEATPSIFQIWKLVDGEYVLDTELLDTSDGCIHPRKAITMDFNQDSKPDIFVACHGFDKDPFPGEKNKVILSQPDGSYSVQDASDDVGFFHAVTSVDLNGDEYPDIMVTNNFDQDSIITMLNNGNGTFRREYPKRLPSTIEWRAYFSLDFVDVDEDGDEDLFLGGHEWENGSDTVVLLNPGDNNFTNVTPTVLPPVANEGVVLDFAVTGSDASRTIWIVRTSGGDGTFYQSRTVQKVLWPTLASSIPLNERPANWFPWLIPATVNDQKMMVCDDASKNVSIPQ